MAEKSKKTMRTAKSVKKDKIINTLLNDEVKIQVYKWMKILQSIILMALGAIFVAISFYIDKGSCKAIGLSLGVILTIYGLIDVLAGYLLHRSLISQDVFIGILLISLSLLLFTEGEQMLSMITIVLMGFVFGYAVMLIVFGVDKILERKTKQNILLAVLSFIGSALLIAGGIVYLVFSKTDSNAVMKYAMLIFGILLIVLGVIALILSLYKLYNTKKVQKEVSAKKKEKEVEKPRAFEEEVAEEKPKLIEVDASKDENEKEETVLPIEDKDVSSEDEKK